VIRYVLALALAVTVLGIGTAGLEHAAALRGEQKVESELTTLEDAAVELYEKEDPDPGSDGPRRIVELQLPADSVTTDAADTLVIEPADGQAGSTATYSVGTRRETSESIAVPIRHADGGAVDLSGRTGTQRLVLRLVSDPQRGRVIEVDLG